MDMVPRVGKIYDEPFGDSSALPTSLLSEITRKSVTVCLSGDGGDELFYGYKRYLLANKINFWRKSCPSWVRRIMVNTLDSKTDDELGRLIACANKLLPINTNNPLKRLQNLKEIFRENNPEQLYDTVLSHWNNSKGLVVDGDDISIVDGYFDENISFCDNMTRHDILYYLSDDIMVKVDRAAMANGLETVSYTHLTLPTIYSV